MALSEQRRVANRRERVRTANLNDAFKKLQSIIPKEPSDKMSKINTLRLTREYIDFLNNILNEQDHRQAKSHQFIGSTCYLEPQPIDGKRSDSTGSSVSLCSSSCYAVNNQLSPNISATTTTTTGDEDNFDRQQPASKRRRIVDEQSGQATSLRLASPTSPPATVSPVLSPSSYRSSPYNRDHYTGEGFTDGHGQSPYWTQSSSIHSSPQQTTVDDKSLFLRNAFREYRLTKMDKIKRLRNSSENNKQ